MLASAEAAMTFPKKILLIDHDPSASRGVREALEQTGQYCIREEHDEHTALQVARWFAPDLILLDFMTSSAEATLLAHEAHDRTPVLCMTPLENANSVASAGILGGYTFFAAPLGMDELLRGIEELLFAS